MFPYGCQWGCARENVCSKPGNSCGRPACNNARTKNKSFMFKLGLKKLQPEWLDKFFKS